MANSKCELLDTCDFFKDSENSLANSGFKRMYCEGEKQDQCMRKKYREEHGTPPPTNMLPNGAYR